MIHTRTVKADVERDIILMAITSPEFLRDIRSIMDTSLLRSVYTRRVVEWCLNYYEKYEDAPGIEIEGIFNGERERLDENEIEYFEQLFESLPDPGNAPFRLDQAEQYLKRRKLELLIDQLRSDLDTGEVAKAESRIATFERVERPTGQGVDLFEDLERVGNAIVDYEETMFRVPGVLGSVLGAFQRGDLVAVAGPPKRGKSWWLMYLALCAANANLRVLFVSLEMLENQTIRRFVQMITSTGNRDRTIEVPSFYESDFEQGKWEIGHTVMDVKKMTVAEWERASKVFKRSNRDSRFRVLTFPQDTMTVEDLEVNLENLDYFDNFVPDVIVVDYADIMAPERNAPREYRHKIDHTWKSLRRLAQARNNLVITGSQTDRSTLRRDAGAGNVSEDMRKLAHVAKMIGLNQSTYEKKLGLMRLSVWIERHDDAIESDEAVVTQALGIGKPYLDSRPMVDVKGVYEDDVRQERAE